MQNSSFEVINLLLESATAESYDNHPIAKVNDHEVRMSNVTELAEFQRPTCLSRSRQTAPSCSIPSD
jgi:hypothetical protein